MSKEKGFFFSHPLISLGVIGSIWIVERRRKLRHSPTSHIALQHPALSAADIDLMRERRPIRSPEPIQAPQPDVSPDGRPVTFDEDPEGLRNSSSLFPGGLQNYLDETAD